MSKFTLKSMLTAILMCVAVGGFAQTDGDYYLYNAEAKQFLSRGEDWGTRACVDKYGLPFTWNSTEGSLKFLDNELYLFETNGTFYTDNQSTGFSLEEATDGYYLKSTASGSYITLQAGTHLRQILMPATDQATATVWQLKTKAERDEIVANNASENIANVITASGISATADNFLTILSMATAVDETSKIGTAKFAGGVGDWTFTQTQKKGQYAGVNYGTDWCELFRTSGYHTQTITGLTPGIYKVTVQGFERAGSNDKCNTLAESGYEVSTAALIANGEETNLASWYSGKTEGANDPDNTTQAVAKFNEGKYVNEVYTYVGENGELKLTLNRPSWMADACWVLFNNFTLTRYENFPNALSSTETNELELGKTYVLAATGYHEVSYTATADGYLTITCGKDTKFTGAKYNGTSDYTYTKLGGGSLKRAMAKGATFSIKYYTFNDVIETGPYEITATFEECIPYEPLTLTEAGPANGGEWSGAGLYYANMATYKGQAFYNFSTKVNTTNAVATITIGEHDYSPITLYAAKNGFTLKSMPDTLSAAVAAGLIKAGDTFTVTLSGLVDKEFSANTLKDTTFTYTLASAACTGVTPAASTNRTTLPEEVVFSFDGEISIENAKFYLVNKVTNESTELTGATVEGMTVKIPIPAWETMLPKSYDVIAVGVTNAQGKVITYGSVEGQLTVSYGTSNGYFKATTSPANYDNVASLKTYTITLPGALVYDASQASASEITFGKYNESTYSYDAISGLTVDYTINENVITVTLSEEITAPGDYRLEIPSKLFWAKETYDAENLSTSTCYYLTNTYINCTILPYGPTTVTPETWSTVNELKKITLAFDEEVDCDDEAVVYVVKQTEVSDGFMFETVTDTIAEVNLSYDYTNNNNILVDLGCIDSLGTYEVRIPEGAIWAKNNESKKIGEWVYVYNVDPSYWDPEWVMEVTGATQETPITLIPGRKYQFTEMYNYATYTAEESGKLFFTKLDDVYTSLYSCNEEWSVESMNQNDEGAYWIGVEAGQTVRFQEYGFKPRQYMVTFEAGTPYEPLQLTGTFPAAGGLYSKSIMAPKSYMNGYVEFYFNAKVNLEALEISVVIPSLENKEIDITEDAALEQGNYSLYLAVGLNTLIDDIMTENNLKPGDKIQLVLKNVQDINFAENVLAENPQVELTLSGVVCTSINPDPEYGVEAFPTELSMRFDSYVSCTNGKGYIIDTKSGNKQEFEIASLTTTERESWSGTIYEANLTLPELTLDITSKQFAIEIEGLKDANGNAIAYGEEEGKFVLNYKFSDAAFNFVSADPADGAEVTSIKTTKLTFGDEVHIGPDAEAYFYYGDYQEVTGTFAVDPADPKSVIITWSEEITAPGSYNINISEGSIYDSGYDESKEDLGLADGAYYNPGIYLQYTIAADLSSTKVASITPEQYNFMSGNSLEQLPAEVTITFDGNVKEVTSAYGQQSVGGWSAKAELPEGATALEYTLDGNKMTLKIPADVVSSTTMGSYIITVYATGEDDKPIGYAYDRWGDLNEFAEYISFTYNVEKRLTVTESTPANYSTVKELSTVTLTFSEDLADYDKWADQPCLLNANDDSKVADMTYKISGNQLILTLAEPVTTAGSYAVYVPYGSLEAVSGIYSDEIYVFIDVDPNYVAEEPLAIVSATPENNSTVETLTQVELKLNKEVGYLEHGMLIGDDGESAHSASLIQSETDPTSYTLDFTIGGLFENVVLKKGVTYTMKLTSWADEMSCNLNQGASETVTLTYVGSNEGIQYSDVTLVSITPNEETVITDKTQNKFVVKFSGAVEMVETLTYINLGQGATQPFESIVANSDKTEYTLTIAESVLETLRTTVNIVFAANDLEGKRVQGTSGEGEFSCFSVEYATAIGVPDLTVTPDANVEQALLNVISINCAEGITPSWTAGNITLTDANGNTIALNDPEAVIPEDKASDWSYVPTEWTVALQAELTTVGTYTLTIPAGYFNIGSTQGQVLSSKETVVVFNITEAAQGIRGIRIDADTEVTVYNVTGVVVAKGKASEVLKNLTKGIYIANGKKIVVK